MSGVLHYSEARWSSASGSACSCLGSVLPPGSLQVVVVVVVVVVAVVVVVDIGTREGHAALYTPILFSFFFFFLLVFCSSLFLSFFFFFGGGLLCMSLL